MHELYLARCIISGVHKALADETKGQDVTDVRLRVGKLDAVVTETLTFLFNAIKSDGGLPNAGLTIEEEDVRCVCDDCAQKFTVAQPVFLCPACRSAHVTIVQGRGLTIVDITTTLEEPDHADPCIN
ncbi:MAG: hydrogenase maturation nickel metallochaperone HypA [bacterium]|nr:hydrogenase maturation nickel metallochaperone HypA [bacterium]